MKTHNYSHGHGSILTLATDSLLLHSGHLELFWSTCDFSERNSFNLHDIKVTTKRVEVAFLVV